MKFVVLTTSFLVLLLGTASAQFWINTPPTIDEVDEVEIGENSGVHKILLTGISPGSRRGEEDQDLTITARSNNKDLIDDILIDYKKGNSTANLSFAPKNNANGTAKITIRLDDGETWNNITETSFIVDVFAVNGSPTFKLSRNEVEADENDDEVEIEDFAFNIRDGDPEIKQLLSFETTVESITGSLSFRSDPEISAKNGDLEFRIQKKTYGTALVSVVLTDDGGTANGGSDRSKEQQFTIIVKNINDPPEIDKIPDYGPIAENSGIQKITLTGISPGQGEWDQELTITARSDNTELIKDVVVNYKNGNSTGELVFTPERQANGEAEITVRLDDGQEKKSIKEVSFDVNVFAVNGRPTFNLSSDNVEVEEDAGSVEIKNFATNIRDGDPEVTQDLSFTTKVENTSGNLTFQSNPRISVGDGDLRFAAAPGTSGQAIVSAVLKDDGGTANGGNDQSVKKQFTISVRSSNDPPTIDDIPSPMVLKEDAGELTVGLTGISPGSLEDQKLVISAISDNEDLIASIEVSYIQGQSVATLLFQPLANKFGEAKITVTVDDGEQHHNLTSKSFQVVVNPVADTPEVMDAVLAGALQTSDGLVIDRNPVDGDEVSHFKITNIQNGFLYQNDGVTGIAENEFITYLEGNSGLKFSIVKGVSFNGSFDIQAATGPVDSVLGGDVITAQIVVDNEPPEIISVPDSIAEIARNYSYEVSAADPDENAVLDFSFQIPPIIQPWLKAVDNDDGTAIIFGTPPSGTAGLYELVIRVEDQFGAADEQFFTLRVKNPNKKPELSPLSKSTNEDDTIFFKIDDFTSKFTDADGDTLHALKIANTPQYGVLSVRGIELETNDVIEYTEIEDLIYIPNRNYFGLDIFDWNASDGSDFAQVPQRVNVFIISVNDPPEILDFESNTFTFEYGEESIVLTDSGRVIDVDGDKLEKAVIFISKNYLQGEDSLYYQAVEGFSYTWQDTIGVLTIRGIATPANYESAIRSLEYVNLNRLSPSGRGREIDIVLHDSDTFSIPYVRKIEFRNTFVELDIPTGFTPNGDDVNDTWEILNINRYEDFEIAVYSRTGQKVFESDSPLKEWDGYFSGNLVPAGTYYYLININKFKKVFKGTVTVLR